MMQQNIQFTEAAGDYYYLLDRGYPQKAVLKIIGDRYQLSGEERSMLYRGIATKSDSSMRLAKIASREELPGKAFHIDGFNVFYTIGSYLRGHKPFLCTDGFLRDALEVHGKAFRKEILDKAIALLLDTLQFIKPSESLFYIDSPISNSGVLCQKINKALEEKGLKGNAFTLRSPDFELKQAGEGIICTSDSAIIDYTPLKVFDISHYALVNKFQPAFIDLSDYIT